MKKAESNAALAKKCILHTVTRKEGMLPVVLSLISIDTICSLVYVLLLIGRSELLAMPQWCMHISKHARMRLDAHQRLAYPRIATFSWIHA